jgi:hypothetical protein
MKHIFYCAAVLIALSCQTAKAAFVLSLELEGQTNVQPGAVTTISAYFRETTTAGEASRLSDVNFGLISANFGVTRTASTGNNNITASTSSSQFDGSGPLTFNASSADFPLTALLNTPVGVAAGANSFRILLGTFSVTGGTLGSNATFTIGQPLANDFILGDGILDVGPLSVGTQLSPVSISITAVPEPSAIALLGIFGGSVAFYRWKRRLGRSAMESK